MASMHLWAAIRTVKNRIGTWKGFEQYKALDPSVTRSQWASTIGEARAALANRVGELSRPLGRIPTQAEVTLYATKRASGYMQQVEVYVLDRDTGLLGSRPYVVKTDTLRSRQFIVNEARSRFQAAIDANPGEYPEDIVGVAYVGTHLMVPKG